MSASQAPERISWRADWIAAIVVCAIQMLALLHPGAAPYDQEELYNAAHGRLLQLGHLKDILTLQYRGHCGGCTVNAMAGATLFSILGPSLWAWKLVPVLYQGLATLLASRMLRTTVGPAAAWVFVGIVLFPPPTWLELSMVAWGNHMEAGVIAIVLLYLSLQLKADPTRRRALCTGLALAIALWIGPASAFIALGVLGMFWQTPRLLGAVGMGAISVLIMWGLQSAVSPSGPFETIYYAGESIPDPTRIPEKLWSLLAPRQLVALFGQPGSAMGWGSGWAWVAALCFSIWTAWKAQSILIRPALKFLGAFLIIYCLVRFTVWAPPAPEVAPPGSMRYAAPLYGLLFLVFAAGMGHLWQSGRRMHFGILGLPILLVGVPSRAPLFQSPFPDTSVFQMRAPAFEYARDQIAYLLSEESHAACTNPETDAQRLHAFSKGWWHARKQLDQAPDEPIHLGTADSESRSDYIEGIASALVSELDPSEERGVGLLQVLPSRIHTLDDSDQTVLIAEAAWRRAHIWIPGGGHDASRLHKWTSAVSTLPDSIQEAATMGFGRRWAHDVATWRAPRPGIPVPTHWSEALAEGFAEGLAERWGTTEPIEAPDTPALQAAWERGRERGLQRRWLKHPTR